EAIGLREGTRLKIPIIGLVDTNCDPDEVELIIPGNDDAIRSCGLIIKTLARAIEEGRQKVGFKEFSDAPGASAPPAAAAPVPPAGETVEAVPVESEAPAAEAAEEPAAEAESTE
ncbi:MAG: uS2 family ribosomal protein, partial [Thermoleophilia bacterium]|nr:uS2 family ribosomal protein [Thermoleophilia bacterium]